MQHNKCQTELSILGAIIRKKKARSDGSQICLCEFEGNKNMQAVVKLSPDGFIEDSKCFVWSDDSKDEIKLLANKEFKLWVSDLLGY